jgi:RNA recognition motif-containing protein
MFTRFLRGRLNVKQHYKEFKMNIYVGDLSLGITEEDLQKAFAVFGEVEAVNIIKDNYTGRSKGFGFVEMSDNADAQSAINGIN